MSWLNSGGGGGGGGWNSGGNTGQFMSSLFDNWQTNMYNRQMGDYRQQMDQYQQDMDFYGQQQDYANDMQSYNQWASGASRMAPTAPQQQPYAPQRPIQQQGMNFGNLGGFFGGGGGGGGGSFTPSPAPATGGGFNYGEYDGAGYTAPQGWEDPGIDTASMVDPSAVIASAQPGIMEQMNKAFASAGNRFGSSGMVGTPYADALGTAARGAATDIADITNKYQFQAASDAANREQQRSLAEYQADLQSWGREGDWAHQGQLSDLDRDYGAWGQMGDWQYGAGQGAADRATQQWGMANDWQFQDHMNQQNMAQNQQSQMMQFLPMMMQMMGGY